MATTKVKKEPKKIYQYISWLYDMDGSLTDVETHWEERDAQLSSHAYIKVEIDGSKSRRGICVGVVGLPKKA